MSRSSRLLVFTGGLLALIGLLVVGLALLLPVETAPPDRPADAPTTVYLDAPLAPPGAGTPQAAFVLPDVLADTPAAPPAPTLTPVPHAPERIIIPVLDVDGPVNPVGWHAIEVEGQPIGQWDVPTGYAAGWHNTSAPLGVAGNTVLNGHHNTQGRIFGGLVDLEPGDLIWLEGGGERFGYVVAQKMFLRERWEPIESRLQNARWIQPSSDERLTLVTCWPENDNSYRLIVVALPLAEHLPEP